MPRSGWPVFQDERHSGASLGSLECPLPPVFAHYFVTVLGLRYRDAGLGAWMGSTHMTTLLLLQQVWCTRNCSPCPLVLAAEDQAFNQDSNLLSSPPQVTPWSLLLQAPSSPQHHHPQHMAAALGESEHTPAFPCSGRDSSREWRHPRDLLKREGQGSFGSGCSNEFWDLNWVRPEVTAWGETRGGETSTVGSQHHSGVRAAPQGGWGERQRGGPGGSRAACVPFGSRGLRACFP